MNKNNDTSKSNSISNRIEVKITVISYHDSRTNGSSKSNSIKPNTSKKNEGSNSTVSCSSCTTTIATISLMSNYGIVIIGLVLILRFIKKALVIVVKAA